MLDTIDHVEYVLHPSFADPQRSSHKQRDCFAVYSAGWGTFTVGIEVFFKNGERTLTRHRLELLKDGWPKPKAQPHKLAQNEQLVYESLTKSAFRWRKLSTITRESTLSGEETVAALRSMEARNVARRAFFTGMDGGELWGATSVVGVAPKPGGGGA